MRGANAAKIAADHRSSFVEIAADMEMGYYVDPEGHQHDAQPFLIDLALRHMGYGVQDRHQRPDWWPGTDALRRLVSLKVLLRQAQSQPGSGHPWLDPLLAASVEELLGRLYRDPAAIGMRELVELTTKLARLQSEQRRSGVLAAPAALVAQQGVAIQRVTETIMALPPEEQDRQRRALSAITARLQAGLPEEAAS